jgi:transcriptional regulator with XRE-family HTH domain
MQAIFSSLPYDEDMVKTASRLKAFREAAGLSQRELARQIDQDQSNVRYWENSGNLPRSDVLLPMAKVLGVTVEELLGEPKPRRVVAPGGKVRQTFEAVSRLPRSRQEQILKVVRALLAQHQQEANGSY